MPRRYSEPAWQNVPISTDLSRTIRALLAPKEPGLIVHDFSEIEQRVVAAMLAQGPAPDPLGVLIVDEPPRQYSAQDVEATVRAFRAFAKDAPPVIFPWKDDE